MNPEVRSVIVHAKQFTKKLRKKEVSTSTGVYWQETRIDYKIYKKLADWIDDIYKHIPPMKRKRLLKEENKERT